LNGIIGGAFSDLMGASAARSKQQGLELEEQQYAARLTLQRDSLRLRMD
jgi:hypothetical protein